MEAWAARAGLPERTVQELKNEEFNTVNDLMGLSREDVYDLFHKTSKLKAKQCLDLKNAVEQLKEGNAPSNHGDDRSVAVASDVKEASVAKVESATSVPGGQEYHDCGPVAGVSDSYGKSGERIHSCGCVHV